MDGQDPAIWTPCPECTYVCSKVCTSSMYVVCVDVRSMYILRTYRMYEVVEVDVGWMDGWMRCTVAVSRRQHRTSTSITRVITYLRVFLTVPSITPWRWHLR